MTDLCSITPLLKETTIQALNLLKRYSFSYYDAVVVSSAIQSGCNILYSEDFQNGLIVDDILKIENPFAQ